MASPIWFGGTAAVQQEDRLTPGGTIEAGDKFIVTLTDENVGTQVESVSATGTTVAQACTDIYTQLAASSKTLFQAVTWSNETTYVKGLTKVSGVPFYCTVSTTESDNSSADAQTFTVTHTTASKGPNDWNTTANWNTGTVPVSTDNVTIDSRGSSNDILYGLNQSGVTLATLKVLPGAPKVGQATFSLMISATNGDVQGAQGSAGANGVSRLNINTGTNQTTFNVQMTGTSADTGLEPVRITGAHASNVLVVGGGAVVGIGTNKPSSDAPRFPTMLIGGVGSNPTVNIGPGLVAGAACTLISGNVNANQRSGGNDFATLTLAGLPGVTLPMVDFSNADAAFTVASLVIAGSGNIKVASDTQGTFTAISISFGKYRKSSYALT